ncbi:MAG TPA: bifunctional phosphoribosylaminoimidazolecarboxamide formyltransferase/IMP cyclohydrolase [Kofleriaceae bacterium]|nr:bifunctional phosphoribosylaminoimidazolecarboxamide formyltransferase/IMP cyclohydrolase [Kofleriaceae bacterium]
MAKAPPAGAPLRRALVSVSDKRGLVDLGRRLHALGVEILSTGGTARALSEGGVPVVQVSDYTGAPEILDGRVKTLHPRIHGGLLGRPTDEHRAEMAAHEIEPIDLVVVNLYPFERTVAAPDVAPADAIENIDIGGPSMIRSAAKNHERVAVLVDPDDYGALADELEAGGGAISPETRFRLACKAFAHTAAYDGAIAAYLTSLGGEGRAPFPATLTLQWERVAELRYGENPHQSAAFYRDSRSPLAGVSRRPTLAGADVLQGKTLSYNNILDCDAALALCLEFAEPTAVIIKHTNPCGVASDRGGVAAAYRLARETDPVSAFGGIVAVNREVDAELGRQLAETFLECVVAPGYSAEARELLAGKKNLRLLAVGDMAAASPDDRGWTLRSVGGGLLVQSADFALVGASAGKVVTRRAPSGEELAGLDFAWRVCKHVKSNAIVYGRGARTVAVGAGQMSRVDSAKIARLKAALPLDGCVAASDAFFPFRDGVDVLAEAGATAIIQPGGSIRDEEVIAAADERGLAMIFTGMRHFRH